MRYLALLRGINVGGNNPVEMKRLREVFEAEGMRSVATYINSGNVIFESEEPADGLAIALEGAIAQEFGFSIKVLLRDDSQMEALSAALPDDWTNDAEWKSDVLFLWEEIDRPELGDKLSSVPGVDEVIRAPGAVLWRVRRSEVNRSGLRKIVGTSLYKKITVRNVNTTRRLLEMIVGED